LPFEDEEDDEELEEEESSLESSELLDSDLDRDLDLLRLLSLRSFLLLYLRFFLGKSSLIDLTLSMNQEL
jgi:hypothetical protein